jgi:exopolyphosphatase
MELKNFLKEAKASVNANSIAQIVVGNESADLDSIISANLLAYAYHKMGVEHIIPLINIKKQDYKLRTESYGLLKRYDIDESDLIFIDDIDATIIENANDIKVIVVDHNKLPDNLRAWDANVTAVFDHHQDIGMYADASPRIFDTVGSCSTLIANFVLENAADIYKNEDLAILNISPILVDTVNMDPAQERVTDKDVEIANKLKAFTSADVQKLYDDLQFMKSDVSALSSTDLLRKDYKQWANPKMTYGMASVPLSIADWLKKGEDIAAACNEYMDDNELKMLIVMTAYVEGSFKRELIVVAKDEEFLANFVSMLNKSGLELTAYPTELKSIQPIAVYNQGGLGFSRKKIQPLIEAFL